MGLAEVHRPSLCNLPRRDRHRQRRIALHCCHAVAVTTVKDVRRAASNPGAPTFESVSVSLMSETKSACVFLPPTWISNLNHLPGFLLCWKAALRNRFVLADDIIHLMTLFSTSN